MLTPVLLSHVLTLCALPQAWDSLCFLFLGPKKPFLGQRVTSSKGVKGGSCLSRES